MTLNLAWVRAASDSAIDRAAARRVDGIANRIFLDPMLHGRYPADVQQATATLTDWSFVADGEEEICCQPLDLIGLGMYELLMRLHREHPELELLVTENGAAYPDEIQPDGSVADADRISYLEQHLAAVHRSITDGANVRGYYLWSLLDNFEWAHGYDKRFGIVHVDYGTQVRTLKDSAHWYAGVITENGLSVDDLPGTQRS